MEDEVVSHQEEVEVGDVVDQMQHDVTDDSPQGHVEKQVPLSALQKERKKRQELEMQIEWERQQRQQPEKQPEDDSHKYESATREDLGRSQQEAIRIIEEKLWIKANPEKYEKVNEYLPDFLKQRPNLASAINNSSNRYEEAFTLMDALTPKQQQQVKTVAIKKDAPNSPAGVPKSASLNQAVDLMNMSDSEFVSWRQSQKKRR